LAVLITFTAPMNECSTYDVDKKQVLKTTAYYTVRIISGLFSKMQFWLASFNPKIVVLSAILLLITLAQVFNTALYSHSHKLDNGKIIVHAHPYNKDKESQPLKSHPHTSLEILILQSIQLLFSSAIAVFSITILYRLIQYCAIPVVIHNSEAYGHKKGRGPPAIILACK
jgi:hypothetical protein